MVSGWLWYSVNGKLSAVEVKISQVSEQVARLDERTLHTKPAEGKSALSDSQGYPQKPALSGLLSRLE